MNDEQHDDHVRHWAALSPREKIEAVFRASSEIAMARLRPLTTDRIERLLDLDFFDKATAYFALRLLKERSENRTV